MINNESGFYFFCICLKGNMRKMCNFVRRINYFLQ